MAPILDLSAERAKRERPDEDCRLVHGGNEFSLFSIEYHVGSREFSFNIWAASFDEAEAHVEAIRNGAVLAGMIKARGKI